MTQRYSRQIKFEAIHNFRDLGGYRTRDGRMVVWRRVFRCAELHNMTPSDLARLREEIGLNAVIDLRSEGEVTKRERGMLSETTVRYHHVPFMAGISKEED